MYCAIITTCASQNDAKEIIDVLLAAKLVACVQVFPIESYYAWDGGVNHDAEHLLLIKAKADLYQEIEAAIRSKHKYEVPEIVQLAITDGSASYLKWISQVSKE